MPLVYILAFSRNDDIFGYFSFLDDFKELSCGLASSEESEKVHEPN